MAIRSVGGGTTETITIRAEGFKELEQKYKDLEIAQRKLADKVEQVDRAQGKQNRSNDEAARANDRARRAAERRAAAEQKQRQALIGTGHAIQRNAAISVAAITAVAAASAAPIGLAANFEKEFAMIRTLDYSIGDELRSGLLGLARSLPQTAGDITKSAYQAISAGISADDTPEFLRAASAVATGAASTMTEAVEVLTAAVNGFTTQGITASRAADILFATQRQGVTTVRELGAAFGYVTPLAQFGVSMEEATAAIAAMTKTGMSTADAVTRLQAAVTTLAKPSAKTQKALGDLDVAFGIQNMRAKGLAGVLAELQAATGGSAAAIGVLTRRIEGTQGLLNLTGNGFEIFQSILDGNTKSAGEAAKAFKTMFDTTQGNIDQFKALSEDILRRMGEEVLPQVNDALMRLMAFMQQEGDTIKDAFGEAFDMFYGFVKFLFNNGDRIAATLGSIFVATQVLAFGDALVSMSVALGAQVGGGLAAGIAGAFSGLGAVALLAGAGYLIADIIGDALEERALERTQDVADKIAGELAEIDKQIEKKAKREGADSADQAREGRQQFRSGRRISLAGGRLEEAENLDARRAAIEAQQRRVNQLRSQGASEAEIREAGGDPLAAMSSEQIAAFYGAGQSRDVTAAGPLLTLEQAFAQDPAEAVRAAEEQADALIMSAKSYEEAADRLEVIAGALEERRDSIAEQRADRVEGMEYLSLNSTATQRDLSFIDAELERIERTSKQQLDAIDDLRRRASTRRAGAETLREGVTRVRETATNEAEARQRQEEAIAANKKANKAEKDAKNRQKREASQRERDRVRAIERQAKLEERMRRSIREARERNELQSIEDETDRKIEKIRQQDQRLLDALEADVNKAGRPDALVQVFGEVVAARAQARNTAIRKLEDERARKRMEDERRGRKEDEKAAADALTAQQQIELRRHEIRGETLEAELMRADIAHREELERFRGNEEMKTELVRHHENERARIRREFVFSQVNEAIDTSVAVTGSVQSIMSSYQKLAQARVRSARAQVSAGKMTEEQAKKEQKAAFRLQEQMIIADGVLHLFKGLGQQALALESFATVGGFAKGIAHQAAAAAHLAQAAMAKPMARHARTANAAGLSGGGGGGGGGGAASGPGGFRSDSGAGSAPRESAAPAIQFGDIVLSDVPALLSRDGLNALGQQIAGTVAREINNSTNTAGGPRISRRAMRR